AGYQLPEGFGKKNKAINFSIIVLLIVGIIYFTTGFDSMLNFGSVDVAQDTIVTLLIVLAMAGGVLMMVGGNKKDDDDDKGEEAETQRDIV
ncbi:MAG: hypothetical protein U9P44_02120, partial [archaeon]|nr:hypothetical protein [archaeon]